MSLATKNSADLKAVLGSRPEGSFLFPEHVVVEELLEYIDNTWTSRWEGVSPLKRTSSGESTQTTTNENEPSPATLKKKNASWIKRTFKKIKTWRHKSEADSEEDAITIEHYHSFIPRRVLPSQQARADREWRNGCRYPSWVDWKDEDPSFDP